MTRVALAALSGSSERSRRLRCFQRASLLALAPAGSQTRGWIDFEAGGALLLRYAVESSASLASEAETHGDLLLTPVADGGASCAGRILVALRWSVNLQPVADFVGIADDDVWLHPPRILHDLRPLQPLNDVLLGNIAFAAGWSTSKSRHYGFGTEARSWLRLLREHVSADRDDLDPGPFAFAMGWAFFLSRPLALRVAYSPVASRAAAAGRAVRSPLRKGKCQPSGDSFVGRALVGAAPITIVDLSYANRLLPWRATSSTTEVRKRSAVMHGATAWHDHFQWATCLSTSHATPDSAPKLRCRGAARKCGEMECGGPRELMPADAPCASEPSCARRYGRLHNGSAAFCIAAGTRKLPRAPLRATAVCDAGFNESVALQTCAAGFANL